MSYWSYRLYILTYHHCRQYTVCRVEREVDRIVSRDCCTCDSTSTFDLFVAVEQTVTFCYVVDVDTDALVNNRIRQPHTCCFRHQLVLPVRSILSIILLRSRFRCLTRSISRPHTGNTRVTPYWRLTGDGVQVLVIRRECQVCGLCSPVCDIPATVDAYENKTRHVSRNVIRPYVSVALYRSHTHTGPSHSCRFTTPVMHSNRCAISLPPGFVHFAIDSRRERTARQQHHCHH